MENRLSNINIFNNSDILNINDCWSSTYFNLPLIMSSLNVNASTASTSTSDINNTSQQLQNLSDSENELPSSSIISLNEMRELRSSSRTAKDNLHRINRRTISKPKKLQIKEINLTPAAIKKFYIESSKKVKKFRPTNLETIFEEPIEDIKNGSIKYTGKKKLKRSLSCSDGLNIKTTTIKNRRLRIKKTYGKRFALKKITFEDFHEKLNSRMEESDELLNENKTAVEIDSINMNLENVNKLIITAENIST